MRKRPTARVGVCLLLAWATIFAGVALRMGPLHLPGLVSKYGGSALYAVLLYWLIAALWPRGKTVGVGLLALATAFAVEFFKLVQTPKLDAFRLTLPGKLVLGRFFSGWDLLAYAVGIGVVALMDVTWQRSGEKQIHPG